jgi:hypothetical protein
MAFYGSSSIMTVYATKQLTGMMPRNSDRLNSNSEQKIFNKSRKIYTKQVLMHFLAPEMETPYNIKTKQEIK